MTFAPMSAHLYGRAFKYRVIIALLDGSIHTFAVKTRRAARKLAEQHNAMCWNF